MMAAFSLFINVILGVFNLLPLPPLDGGKVLTGMLPERFSSILIRLEPVGLLLIISLVFFTPLWRTVISPIVMTLLSLMAGNDLQQVLMVRDLLFDRASTRADASSVCLSSSPDALRCRNSLCGEKRVRVPETAGLFR